MSDSILVYIPDRYTCRGMTFLPQQFVGPIPKGEYELAGPVEVDYSDLGKPKRSTGHLLVSIPSGDKWYVSPAVAEFLQAVHSAQGSMVAQ